MSENEPKRGLRRDRFRASRPDFRFDQMFETHSEAWERVGLAVDVNQKTVQKARRRAVIELLLFIAVVVVYDRYKHWFHLLNSQGHVTNNGVVPAVRIAAVVVLLGLGWALARDVGRIAAPTFFRRMDPGTAGTVGFITRLATAGIVILVVLDVAGVSATSIVAGSAFTAVILGLAAQQTLGNLFAGMVLLSARPFRVGERVRFQAGALGGQLEGVVSSLGLLYTTLARGEDRIMVPNNGVLAAVVVPVREPEPVDVRVRLSTGTSITQVQALLDDRITVPTRRAATVILAEIDGDDLVVRIQATPDRADDGARLADEVIGALAAVTGEHEAVDSGGDGRPVDGGGDGHPLDSGGDGAPARQEARAGSRRT
jgi:small conductance mechanosensitive channel